MKKALVISNSSGLVTDFLDNDFSILKNRGYEITCVCNTNYPGKDTDDFFKKYDVNVINVEFPIRNLDFKLIIKSYNKLKKIMKKEHFDIVHCHSTIAAALGRAVAKKYRKKKTKVYYTSHGFPFYEGNNGLKSKLFYYIENYYSKYTDGILTICQEDFENAKKMQCKNVKLMHGVGVDVEKFINCKIDRKIYRKKLGIDEDSIAILSIGELNTNKNHQIVIKALSHLKNKKIIYVICGREVTEIGKKNELEQLAKQKNVIVKILGFRKDIPEICKICDIGILPSFKEGLGLSGIEMLASGMPVVGSNRQGIKDYIIDGKTGFLANPEDEMSFKEAIEKSIKLIYNKDVKNNCILETKKFNKEQAYNKIEELYNIE